MHGKHAASKDDRIAELEERCAQLEAARIQMTQLLVSQTYERGRIRIPLAELEQLFTPPRNWNVQTRVDAEARVVYLEVEEVKQPQQQVITPAQARSSAAPGARAPFVVGR